MLDGFAPVSALSPGLQAAIRDLAGAEARRTLGQAEGSWKLRLRLAEARLRFVREGEWGLLYVTAPGMPQREIRVPPEAFR